jgi:NAD(P)H-dependent FMN reductase
MITIIVGSNRKGNLSEKVADIYRYKLTEKYGIDSSVVLLQDMPSDVVHDEMYKVVHPWIREVIDNNLIPADRFIIISPEYNGSITGILKLFLDAVSVEDADKSFHWKKAALVGLSVGKFGNWLGLEHLLSIMNYMKVHTYAYKVSIAKIYQALDDRLVIKDPKVIEHIIKQLDGFVKF